MGKQITKSGTGKIIFLIAVTAVFALLPLLIFQPIKQKIVEKTPQSRFTFMTNTPADVRDDYGLIYWQKAGNPMLFAKPDAVFGFSALLQPEQNLTRPESRLDHSLPMQDSPLKKVSLPVAGKRDPVTLLPEVRIPLVNVQPADDHKGFSEPAVAVLEDGTIVPLKEISAVESSVKPLNPSLFYIRKENDYAAPVIRLIRSCGDPKLDQTALKVLYHPAAADQNFRGMVRIEWKQMEDPQ
jgi:hypothetical protein